MQISFIMDVDSIDTAEVSPPKTNGKTSPSSATEPESTPTPKSVPESEPSKASKPTQESEPSPTAKPSSESEPSKGSKPSLESESSPTPKQLPTPEPASESEPSKGSKPSQESESSPASKPSQESESSPASKPSPEQPKSKPSSKSEPPTKGSKLVARKSTTAAPKQAPTPPPTNGGEGSAPKKVHSVARKSTTTVARTTTTPSSNAAPSSKSASPPSSKSASSPSSKSASTHSSKSASTPSSNSASGPLSKTVAITESPKVARKSTTTTTTSLKRPRPTEGPSSSNSSITIVPAPKVARKSTTSTPKTKKPGPKSKSMAEKRDSSSSTNKSHGRSKSPVRVDIKTTLSDSDLSPAASDAEDKPHKAGPKSKKFKLASILPKSKKGDQATKTEKSSPAKTETPTKISRKGMPKIRKIALTTPTSATRRDGQTYPILREGSTEFDRFYDLPDEWVKKLSQRQDGASKGCWDAYLYPPKRFKHKQLRSAMELMKFVMKNPDCELDPYYVNMDKNPNTIMDGNENPTPTTLRLMELVRRVKSNEEVNIEDFLNVKEKNKSKNKTKELQENFVVKEKKKMKGPRGRPKKSGPTPLELEMNLPKINMTEGIKLEKIFHQCTSKPSKHELKSYARDLDLKYRDVKKWFNIKWAAKEKYNAETVTTTQDESDDDEDLISRPRQVQRFDVLMSDDDPLDEPSVDDEPSAFDNSSVVIENGEQDNDELITGDETKTDDVELIVGDSNKTDDAELIIADDNKSEEDEDDEAIEIDAEVFI